MCILIACGAGLVGFVLGCFVGWQLAFIGNGSSHQSGILVGTLSSGNQPRPFKGKVSRPPRKP